MNLSFFLTVAQNITESEAEAITHLTDVFSSRRTDEYNLLGLSRPGISKAQPRGTDDEKKIDENKEKDGDKQEYVHKRLYLLSFNVDPIMYMDMYNNIDIDTITNELNRIINNKYYQNLPWIIERIKMEQTIKNPNAGRYFKLLNLGSPLDSICMRKSFDKRRSSSVLKFSSTCADLEIKSLNESELYTELT